LAVGPVRAVELIADSRTDYDLHSPVDGESSIGKIPDSHGTGYWNYYYARNDVPYSSPSSLTPLTYTSNGIGLPANAMISAGSYYSPGQVYGLPGITNGCLIQPALYEGTPEKDEEGIHPGLYNDLVIRWTAGSGLAGPVNVAGNARELGRIGDGITLGIYLNGALVLSSGPIASLFGVDFSLDLVVTEGTNIDFVVGPGAFHGPSTFYNDHSAFSATITGDVISKLPLGKSVSKAKGGGMYRLYIPDRLGGRLKVTTTSGQVELYYPDTKTKVNGPTNRVEFEVAEGKQGCYFIKHVGDEAYTIANEFSQEGQATRRPWNYWYWPILPQQNIDMNLYGSPLEKYDQAFSPQQSARAREIALAIYFRDQGLATGYSGHCWGGSIASILLPSPIASSYNNVDFSSEECKGLTIKLAEGTVKRTSIIHGLPALKPNPGPDELDGYIAKLHQSITKYLREYKIPLQSDLRDPNGEDPAAIWYHAIYGYTADFIESADEDSTIIEISMTLRANKNNEYPSNGQENREEYFIYKLKFDNDGVVVDDPSSTDWEFASGFPPAELSKIVDCSFEGLGVFYNQEIAKANVKKIVSSIP